MNPWFPLPPDYDELTKAGQKEARLSVLLDNDTPEKLVRAWDFFRNVYLKPMGEQFYPGGFVESPALHFQLVHDLGQYGRNATAAPRGSAKSTVIGTEIPILLLLTRPGIRINLCLATDGLVAIRFNAISDQFTDNPLIIQDFGEQRPKRGHGMWNGHMLSCTNGSRLQGYPVLGKKRGARPTLFILDDPEDDPNSRNKEDVRERLLEQFETIMFRQIIPMLKKGSVIFWIGTLIDRRSFLYHACYSDDSRFKFWNRRIYRAGEYDGRKLRSGTNLWPGYWDEQFLEDTKLSIGWAAFSGEFLNNPVSESERILPISDRGNEYVVSSLAEVPVAPFECTEEVIWQERRDVAGTQFDSDLTAEALENVYTECRKPYKDLVTPMFRFLTFDFASTVSQYSDYSCIADLGLDTNNNLWILEMWMKRAKEAELLREIFLHGLRWRHRILGIEAAGIQTSFAEAVQDFLARMPAEELDGWQPRVIPIKYPVGTSKASRIAGLEWRFRRGRIKYPAHLAEKWPYNQLYSQTRDFTLDLALLTHDDAIDTIAMSQYIVKARPIGPAARKIPDWQLPLIDRIRRNIPLAPGIPLLSGVDPTKLTAAELEQLVDKAYRDAHNKNRKRRYYDGRPNVIPGGITIAGS